MAKVGGWKAGVEEGGGGGVWVELMFDLTLSSLKTATAVERIFPFIPENR